MTTTYSPSLKLSLIGTGDQSGTWGATTNNNLGTLLEQAITGVQAISLSGISAYTLTNLNGVSDDARNMCLIFSGTPSGAPTITAPAQNKLYVIVNNTTQNLTMAASGGAISLVIPALTTAQCYCDAANVSGNGIGFYSAQTSTLNTIGAATSTASSISGTTLTIGGTLTGTFSVGQIISGTGVTSGTAITALGSGSGGAGTYTVSISQSVASTAINGAAGATLNSLYVANNLSIGGVLSVTQDAFFNSTGEIKLPTGTTSQRSALPTYGMFRYNSTTNQFEGYNSVVGTAISTILFTTTTATLTTATSHGLSTGAVVTISGASPSAYNGTFSITVTGSTTFTYTMLSNPGANASPVGSYTTGYWGQVGGGAQAQGVVYENGQIIAANYTMTTGNNGESVGPITVNSGVTVTIPSGSRWVIL